MNNRKSPLESFYEKLLAHKKKDKQIVNKILIEIFEVNINIFFNKN